MIVSSRLPRLHLLVPLVLSGVIPGCGTDGDDTVSATGTQSGDPTPGSGLATSSSSGASQGETVTPTTSAGEASMSATQGTTEVSGTTDPTTATTANVTATAGDTTTTGTTGPVDPSSSTGDSSTTGVKLDMGPQGCDPDLTPSTFDYIWIANSSQGTVSKIITVKAANCGVYSGIQAVA
ncbi:MAG: hypothetical protein H0T76_05970 [Nannocystis sp.]|nr:hypothetical protein [Nannocystis sp.]MBA3546007.1 hypothetical protein [Nannocystis sp.]